VRRAFTLIELLVIIAIIGVMVTVGVVSISAGKGAARVKGATRDVFAAIRHARSTALVTMKPVIITYSTVTEDDETMAKIEITSAKLLDTTTDRSKVQTFSGEPLEGGYDPLETSRAKATGTTGKNGTAGTDGTTGTETSAEGDSVEDILFAPINTEVVKGMRVKVVLGDEGLGTDTTVRQSKISVFSNVDFLLGKFKEAKAKAEEKKAEGDAKTSDAKSKTVAEEENQEPVSVVWETNGRVDPHQVWVYADGMKPEDGLMIRIDRFGAAKVLSGDGREDDE